MSICADDHAFADALEQLSATTEAFSGLAAAIVAGPLSVTLWTCVVFSTCCYAGALASGYWSYVDRLWSVVPAVYALTYAGYACSVSPASFPTCPRLSLMAALATVWAARLTYNFWRKGGYGSEEDYRWPVLRRWFQTHDPLHPLGREIFLFAFVSAYQHLLLWLLVAPVCQRVFYYGNGALGAGDGLLTAVYLVVLGLEALCDEQQWAFQSAKHKLTPTQRVAAGGDFARGFCTTGVFRVSRHLNFFCEQTLWWLFYAFSLLPVGQESQSAGGGGGGGTVLARCCVNGAGLGALLLSLLFLGSTTMTERLSVAKYGTPYEAYQRTTSRLVPWWPGPSLDSPRGATELRRAAESAAKTRTE